MKWTWTIRDLLSGMLIIALAAAGYWNSQHGRREFNLWTTAVLGVLLVCLALYQFVRRRQPIYLLPGVAGTCIAVYFWWLIANG